MFVDNGRTVMQASRVADFLRVPAAPVAGMAVWLGDAFCQPEYAHAEDCRPPSLCLEAVPDPACMDIAGLTFGPENLAIVAGATALSVFSGVHRIAE